MKTKSILKWILILFVLVGFVATPLGAVKAQEGGGEEIRLKSAAPGVPVLEDPNGDVYNIDDPEFAWKISSGATSYDLVLYATGSTTPVVSRTVNSSICHNGHCWYQTGVSLWNGNYRWRLRAKNSSGSSAWSTYMNFAIISDSFVGLWPSGNTTMARPTLKWSRVNGALNYQLLVYSNTLGKYVLNTLVSRAYCSGSICAFTPNLALNNGSYKWKVMGKGASQTTPYTAYKSFTVSKNGFNSDFAGSSTGWIKRAGATWGIYNSAYYYTNGMANKVSTAYYQTSYSNFVITARMKRVTSDGRDIGLLVRGNPTSVNEYYDWNNGYYFGFYPYSGIYIIGQYVGGEWRTLHPLTYSEYINKNSWNVVKVVANGNFMGFYINDHLVWADTVSALSSGYVGLKTWTGGSISDRMLVDWVTLGVLPGGVGLKVEGLEFDKIDPKQTHLNAEALKNSDK